MPLVGVGAFGPECGDLVALSLEEHRDCPVLDPCGDYLAEYGDDLLRKGIGAEIVVTVLDTEKPVTDSASDNVQAEAVFLENGGESGDFVADRILSHISILPPITSL